MDAQKKSELASGTIMPNSLEPEMVILDEAAGLPMPEGGAQTSKAMSPLQESLARFRRDKRALVSMGIIVFFILLALIGPPIYQHIGGPYVSDDGTTYGPQVYHSYGHIEAGRKNEGPSGQYWLGTDQLGRDILARLMQGVLISLAVALIVEIIDVCLGLLVGVLAGFYGGWIDQLLARFADLMFAFPGLLLVILISGILGPTTDVAFSHVPFAGNGNARLLLISVALAFTTWPTMARLVRGQSLQLKEQQFIEAARTSGTKNGQIILKHIIPNLFSIVIVLATLNISLTIVGEASISFFHLGVQNPGSSLGLMIADATPDIVAFPWAVLVPCITLALVVLAFSFLGDSLRDAFDPRSNS
jgi:oligopeptide transport system permease protein